MRYSLFAVAALMLGCGGPESSASAAPHDFFDGVWQVSSLTGSPSQQFNFYRANDTSLRASGGVFFPATADPLDPIPSHRVSYFEAVNLAVSSTTVTGTADVMGDTMRAGVPFAVTFDSNTHFTGTLGNVSLEGSR